MALLTRRPKKGPRYRVGNPERVSARHNYFEREFAELRKENPGSLTAAGELVRHGQATILRRLIQAWQIRAFGYYDLLGEIKYASQFYSRALSQLELYVAYKNDDGEYVPVTREKEAEPDGTMPTWDDGDAALAIDAVDRIKDPGGSGRTGLLSSYGRLMFLAGECYLFVSENQHTKREQWEFLSTDELRLMDGLYTRFKAPQLAATQFKPAPDDSFTPIGQEKDDQGRLTGVYDETAVAYRIWKRHPRFSELADATMEGVLDLCEELVLLTQAVRARARSRLAGSGILFLDDRITTTPSEPTPDEDPQEDPFIADLTEAMTKPIINEGTAAAVVPLVARVRVPDGMRLQDLVYHLQIIDPTQIYPETGLRMECIKRIAIGLDMPSEILLGVTDANHWTAWLVDEQSWKAHLQPVAQQLVEDLTSAFLGPYLMEQQVEQWDRFVILYDASKVINHPDRGKDAKDLHDRGVLSDQALRESVGFDEDDAPSEQEKNVWMGIKLRDASVAIYGEPALTRGAELEPEEGVILAPSATGGETEVPGATGETASEAEKQPPAQPSNPGEQNEDVVGSLNALARASMVQGAAQLALLRAREAAGNRLLTLARRDKALADDLAGVSTRDVAATLGRARVRSLANVPKEPELVGGARELILDALRVFGIDDEGVRVEITEAIERHAVSTLYDLRPAPMPDTFPSYVSGLLRAAAVV